MDTPIKKILIIEDDVFLGDILLKKLQDERYDATLARDGKEGLFKISEIHPDLVLLDIILPSMNGYEILEAKSKDATIRDIPVIVISNSGQPVEISRVLAMGVKDYLVKAQFDPGEVLEKVRSLFSSQGTVNSAGAKGPDCLTGKKVMWVEDDKFLNDLIAQKLSLCGCKLFHAEDGESAIPIAAKEKPDVIMLDLLLPGMNGFEILQAIKANPDSKDIPILVLSNFSQQGDLDRCKKLGAVNFLVKASVTLDEIVGEIRKIVCK